MMINKTIAYSIHLTLSLFFITLIITNAVRLENKLLHEKVHTLTQRVRVLTVEKETLQVQVEDCQRQIAVLNELVEEEGGGGRGGSGDDFQNSVARNTATTAFLSSGNHVYPCQNEFTLSRLHGPSNPSTCVLSPDDIVLASGGADGSLVLFPYNRLSRNVDPAVLLEEHACRYTCPAPIIAIGFSDSLRNVVAAGCMDGSVHVIEYTINHQGCLQTTSASTVAPNKHSKYVRTIVWTNNCLATSSADGSIHVYQVRKTLNDHDGGLELTLVKSLHLPNSVEAMVFFDHYLIAYVRDTPYLSYFDMHNNYEFTSRNINAAAAGPTGGFDEHVSFCILDLKLSHNGKYLAAATDASRNIIFDPRTGQQLRNVYGHDNDSYSQPKIGWSSNDQYLLGNTQHAAEIVVWDIATTQIVERLSSGHVQSIRDLWCSSGDCMVTTSFDKQTKVWFAKE